MKFPLRVFLLLPGLVASALAGFTEDFAAAKAQGPEAMEKVQKDYAKSEANDPAYYIQLANYWFKLSQQPFISKKPPAGGDFSLTDKKTGKEAGSLSRYGVADPKIGRAAPDLLFEAVKKFPKRMDIGLGLVFCLRKEDRFADAGKAMIVLLAAYESPGPMLGQDDEPLEADKAGDTIANAAYDTAADLYQAGTKPALGACRQLATAMTKTFPENVRAYNLLAAIADKENDTKAVITWLEKAHGVDPSDSIVIINLAEKYLETGDKANARTLAQSILDSREASAQEFQPAAQRILSKAK